MSKNCVNKKSEEYTSDFYTVCKFIVYRNYKRVKGYTELKDYSKILEY